MLTVNELAIQSNVPGQVVRYYIRIGLIRPEAQQDNGYRLFNGKDVARLRFIRIAKHLGYTLNEIKQIIEHADRGESPCPDVRRIIRHRIKENQIKIDEMSKLQKRMKHTLRQWERMPDHMPDGDSVCYLIESKSKES